MQETLQNLQKVPEDREICIAKQVSVWQHKLLVILPAAQSDDTPTASGLQAYQNKEEDEHDYNRKKSRNH